MTLHMEETELGKALLRLAKGPDVDPAQRDKITDAAYELDRTATSLGLVGLENRAAYFEATAHYYTLTKKEWRPGQTVEEAPAGLEDILAPAKKKPRKAPVRHKAKKPVARSARRGK